tara:strand:- start:557 stop:697 length:141 start_codon:yes stop_codon:yes gene_type:complete
MGDLKIFSVIGILSDAPSIKAFGEVFRSQDDRIKTPENKTIILITF